MQQRLVVVGIGNIAAWWKKVSGTKRERGEEEGGSLNNLMCVYKHLKH
jgi:hypothetical protein